MNTIVLIFLGIVIVATLSFLASLFRLTLDDADFWLKVISGVLAAFTFLAGAAALVTGTITNNRLTEKVLILEKETADAKRKYLELERSMEPRRITTEQGLKIVAILKDKPSWSVEVLYPPGNSEAYGFATHIWMSLMASGWEFSRPEPDLSQRSNSGLVVEACTLEDGTPPSELINALWQGGHPTAGGLNTSIPKGKIILFVGQRDAQPTTK